MKTINLFIVLVLVAGLSLVVGLVPVTRADTTQFRAAVLGGSGIFTDSGQSLGSSASSDVALGDVDGDGDLDAFVTNWSGEANKVWLNDGTGTFSDSGQTLGSSYSERVALGDVDGDGDLDAFVTNSNPYVNKVWLNDGTGTFSDSGQGLGSSWSLGVALGDVDGDGDLDAFVANLNGANKVWLNDGAGTFSDSGQTLGSSSSESVALGDVDGDGDLDAFVGNKYQANKVWLNDGTGTFSDSGQSLGSSFSDNVVLGDVDGDDDLDAFVANYDGQANKVWLNDGSGVFSDSGQSLGSSNSGGVALGDVDGDGDLDAFVANRDGQANKVWLNRNRVESVAPAPNTHNAATSTNLTVTVRGAVSHATVTTQSFFVHGGFQGHLDGSFSFGSTGSYSDIVFDPAGDFHPGELVETSITTDVVVGGVPLGIPYVWQFQTAVAGGSGVFADSGQSLGSLNSFGVALGDVDGDGDLDAFVGNKNQANKVWLNDGTGSFSDSGQSLGGSASDNVALGDVDGDGDLDAFVANHQSQANKVWLNDGTGTFGDSGQSLGNSASNDVALGDVDGDGDLDAFVANESEANKVWLNDGTGTFSDSGQSLSSSWSVGLALGDVDGDGDLDAFVTNIGANKVWLNDGTGTFSDSGQSLGSSHSERVGLEDVDGDGDLDAFVANWSGANKMWLNDGTGTFSDSGQSLGSSASESVALGDVDGDGDLDAFVGNKNQGNKVWLNDGIGTFSDSGQSLGSSWSDNVALGDVDGDGDLDTFVANCDSQANKVWLNQPAAAPAVWSEICVSQRMEITGLGMGDRYHTINPQTLSLTDPSSVNGLLAQMAGRIHADAPIPNRVTFSTDAPQSITLHAPTSDLTGFTYETELQPTGQITASVSGIGDDYRTPRGLILYSQRATTDAWTSVGKTTNNYVYAGRGEYAHTEVLTFPPLEEATDLYITAVVIDNDDDSRPLVVEATAGGVMESVTELGPTDGDGLNIVNLMLQQVPAGTSQVGVTLRSPQESNGDSLVLVGLNVSHPCGQASAIDLVSFTAQAAADYVTLAWETGTEVDNAGFNLWRGEAADSPYTKINETLILAEGDAHSGASYTYTDTDVVKGVTYYYKLEDVDIHGLSTLHGPVSATPSSIRRIYMPLIFK